MLPLLLCTHAYEQSSLTQSFDADWKFFRGDNYDGRCTAAAFPLALGDTRCMGLANIGGASDQATCQEACCNDGSCQTWQFCPDGAPCAQETPGCWIGKMNDCSPSSDGWISRGRTDEDKTCTSTFCEPDFDDSTWRTLDVPHDWSIEDLPPRDEDQEAPVLAPRYGTWAFSRGDDPSWSDIDFDDSGWQRVKGGEDWRVSSNYTDKNAFGWYRQTVDANALLRTSANTRLSLGVVAGADEAWINGVKVGGFGDMSAGPECDAYVSWRSYAVPANLLKPKGNVVAVRVLTLGGKGTYNDGTYPGGLYDDPRLKDHDVRKGAFDAGASLNGRSYGYTVGGVGWYRKHFVLPHSPNGARPSGDAVVRVRFDGVYMNSDLYLNGQFIGNHPYGYTTFEYVLPAQHLRAAPASNLLAMRVNNAGRNSRWYSGSGIFRHTYLTVTPPVFFPTWALYVSTPHVALSSPAASGAVAGGLTAQSATVQVEVTVANAGPVPVSASLRVDLSSPHSARERRPSAAVLASAPVNVTIGANSTAPAAVNLTLASPRLWGPPAQRNATAPLYVASATLGGETVSTTFGVRTISFDVESGFLLNGQVTKFYGGCMHHDNGPLGSAAIDRAEERRVQLMRAQGYNAIRTSHNPVSPAFLDACDREGILVMDEAFDCWERGKNDDDYHLWFDAWWKRDMEAMVLRDRNHPSIVLWSIGNEIPIREEPAGVELSAKLSAYVRELDKGSRGLPSGRVITSAVPGVNDNDDDFFAPLEVAGYNYSPDRYVSDHERIPSRIIVGTESFPTDSFKMWDLAWQHPHVLGDFIWTAYDYIGESDIGYETQTGDVDECAGIEPFPFHISFCGDVDNAGHLKPQAYYRRVLWGVDTINLAVHVPGGGDEQRVGSWGWPVERQSWSWPGFEGTNLSVNVYAKGGGLHSPDTACKSVGLSAGGVELGRRHIGYDTQFTATFDNVPYAPGTLTASCYASSAGPGHVAGTAAPLASVSYTTAGAPHALRLSVDAPTIANTRDALAFVTVAVVDAAGVLVPHAELELTFTVKGDAGEIAALGNGNPQDIESTQGTKRRTWRGQALAVLRPSMAAVAGGEGGTIQLIAEGKGVGQASVEVRTR